jgi:hypothetical protein
VNVPHAVPTRQLLIPGAQAPVAVQRTLPTRGFVMQVSDIGIALLAVVAVMIVVMVISVGFGSSV